MNEEIWDDMAALRQAVKRLQKDLQTLTLAFQDVSAALQDERQRLTRLEEALAWAQKEQTK